MPKSPDRPQEKSPRPPATPPAIVPTWALAIVPTKRMGQVEHAIFAFRIEGDRVTRTVPVPDANWEKLDGALHDLARCAVRLYRFRQADELLAGRA